jgi:hypothetical protein
MTALARDGNNLAVDAALVALPIHDCSLAKLAAIQKNMDRHSEREVAHADVHATVSAFVFGNFVHKQRQVLAHICSSPRNTERFGIEQHGLEKYNPINGLPFSLIRPTVARSAA